MHKRKKKISFTPKNGTKDIFRDTTQIDKALCSALSNDRNVIRPCGSNDRKKRRSSASSEVFFTQAPLLSCTHRQFSETACLSYSLHHSIHTVKNITNHADCQIFIIGMGLIF